MSTAEQQETGAAGLRRRGSSVPRCTTGVFVDSLADDVTLTVTGQYSWSQNSAASRRCCNDLNGHADAAGGAAANRPLRFIAEGDYVVVEARGDNVTKAGLRYDNQYCMVWRIENGKIKEIKEYCDSTLVRARCWGRFRKSESLPRADALGGVCAGGRHRRREQARRFPGSTQIFIGAMLTFKRVWRQRRHARRQLAVMCERDFQDIGICRCEIACENGKPLRRT